MEPKIGECSKHPGRSMIDCPACAIEEMRKDIKLKPSVHEIWCQCVEDGTVDKFKDILIEHGHIKSKKK